MWFIIFVIIVVVALSTYVGLRRRGLNAVEEHRTARVLQFIGVVALLAALASCLTVVPAGHVGIIDLFGRVSPNTLKAGINLVNPLARVVKMSVKTQEMKEGMDVPSKEGLSVQLEVSVLYHLDPEKAADVYKSVGENYTSILLEPQFRSVSRGVTAGFEAKALYTSERELLANQIYEHLRGLVEPRGISIESTPLRRVGLPRGLSQSIEEKLRAEQESQRMQFVLAKERQEAERKRIEAQGIADFQNIVARGISEQLLRWKGIEATERLANSANAKTVIVGSGKDGLPLILGSQ
jgi:regulator of protease activity HflC (stomatin/prohibitin superfamily)